MAKFSLLQAASEIEENARTPKRVFIVLFACVLLLFALAASILPFVPSYVVAAPPLILLSIYSPTIYGLLKRKSEGHPKAQSWFDHVRNWVIRRLH